MTAHITVTDVLRRFRNNRAGELPFVVIASVT